MKGNKRSRTVNTGMEKNSGKEVVSGVRENEDWAEVEFGQSRT